MEADDVVRRQPVPFGDLAEVGPVGLAVADRNLHRPSRGQRFLTEAGERRFDRRRKSRVRCALRYGVRHARRIVVYGDARECWNHLDRARDGAGLKSGVHRPYATMRGFLDLGPEMNQNGAIAQRGDVHGHETLGPCICPLGG